MFCRYDRLLDSSIRTEGSVSREVADTVEAGRPLTLVMVRGGGYGEGTPRAGWDHATGYLLRILRDVWGADVTLVEAELTLAEVNPAMAGLRDAAAVSRAQAHEHAAAVGHAHAALVAA